MADDTSPTPHTPQNASAEAPSMLETLAKVWRRINERKMVQWTIAYVALAYSVQHGVVLTGEAFDWPHAVQRIAMLLLALGLPVVMTIAWYHGDRASQRVSGPELSIISILLVIGSLLFFVFVRPSEEVAAGARPAVQQAGVAAARAASVTQAGAISIAVLPFTNLSSDPEQEFFSDGMTEEITAALANVSGLSVVGRTSAFQYKGRNEDLRAMGQALGATHLIEGSVRKAGTRVRITAQLIRANSGTHLWTENYDRDLTDIFAVQEDIAQAIAGALRVPLGLQQGDTLVRNRTKDLESYDEFLRAKALYRARDLTNAIKLLEPVVARDPGFAPAWALLGQVYVVALNFSLEVRSGTLEEARRVVQSTQDKAEMAAREAIRLDSRNAAGYGVLARVQAFHHHKWAAGDDLYKQALALDPNEPEVLLNYAVTLASEGHLKDALSVMEKLRALEPFVPIFNVMTAHYFHLNRQTQAAIPIFETIPPDAGGGYYRNVFLAQAYGSAGRYGAAADTLLLMTGDQVSRRSVENAARLLRSAPEKVKAPQALPALDRELNFVYAYIGAPERVMENYERADQILSNFDDTVWIPELTPLRKTEQFKTLVRAYGLVEYWRARGWPDLCHPVGAGDFACN